MQPILCAVLLFASPAGLQEAAAQPAPDSQQTQLGTPEARAIWERLTRASRVAEASPEPIRAFVLEAQILVRDGVRTNELRASYQFLEPHYIRFRLPGGRETGRGPGQGRKSYWLRDGEEVLVLDGREDAEDRRQVDEMTAIVRNYLALSDPARLSLELLETLDAPPAGLPRKLRREARKLAWIRLASRDFALMHGETQSGAGEQSLHVVELGVDRESSLPGMAVIRAQAEAQPFESTPPMLIRLSSFEPQEGFLLPQTILVHRPDPNAPAPAFEDKPAQEIYVTDALLRPELSAESFAPR